MRGGTAMKRLLHRVRRRDILPVTLAFLFSDGFAANSCNVTTNSLVFTGYNTIAEITSASTVTVNCNNNGRATATPVTVSATAGNGTMGQRQMVNGASTLDYNLYIDPGYGTVWGNTAGNQFAGITNGATGNVTFTVYGKIRGGQNVAPGAYTTTTPVVVTATY